MSDDKLSCLILKPKVADAAGREDQQNAIENAIQPAIVQANLQLIGSENGVDVDNITPEIVQLVHEADVVVVDINRYNDNDASISPYLAYFLGLRHALGSQTILVASATDHLPDALRNHHTLIYQYKKIRKFYDQFKQTIEKINAGRPDNLIQEYRQELLYRQKEKELDRVQAELRAKEAQLAALKQQGKQAGTTINFRRVN